MGILQSEWAEVNINSGWIVNLRKYEEKKDMKPENKELEKALSLFDEQTEFFEATLNEAKNRFRVVDRHIDDMRIPFKMEVKRELDTYGSTARMKIENIVYLAWSYNEYGSEDYKGTWTIGLKFGCARYKKYAGEDEFTLEGENGSSGKFQIPEFQYDQLLEYSKLLPEFLRKFTEHVLECEKKFKNK